MKVCVEVLIMLILSVNVCLGQSNEELLQAVNNGEVSQVQLLLEQGVDANAKDNTGKTALMIASNKGNIEIVKLLIDNHADVNARDRGNNTSLMYAFKKGFQDISELLINNDAEINAKNSNGETALMFASSGGNINIVRMLLDQGFDVNAKNYNGMTPLMYSCIGGKIETAAILLGVGAGVNVKDDGGRTPLMFALEKGLENMVDLLLENGADINAKGRNGETALIFAAQGGSIEIIKMLLDQGFDINAKNYDGMTPLMYAINSGNIDNIKIFLDNGADVNLQDNNGRTALIYASMRRDIVSAKMLLDNGADVHSKDSNGVNALLYAFERGFKDMADLLLENGADIQAKSRIGDTALMFAARGRNIDMVKILIDKGFDVNAKNENGTTPFIYAINGRNIDIIKTLLDSGADVDAQDTNGRTALINASIRGNIDIAKTLLDSGADVKVQDRTGLTALLHAFAQNRKDMAEFLLENGADILVKTRNGDTALMLASRGQSVDIVKMLLENGLDVNAKNTSGMTSLMYASQRGNIDIAKLLIENGADIHAKDRNGMTALLNASMRRNIEVAEMLLEQGADREAIERNGKTALMIAFERGDKDIVELLLEYGADLDAKGRYRETAMMFASRAGDIDLVKMLLDRGFDVNAQDSNGKTALIFAIERDNSDVIRLLLEKGADVNVRGEGGMTALLYAISRDNSDIVKILLENGANVNIQSRTVGSAVTMVLEQGNSDMAKILVEGAERLSTEDERSLTALFQDVLAVKDSIIIYSNHIGMVNVPEITVYKNPDNQSDHVGTAHYGDVAFILVQRQEPQVWNQIYLSSGQTGWIYGGDSIEDFRKNRLYRNRNMNSDWVHGQPKNENLQIFDMLPGGNPIETKSKEYQFSIQSMKIVKIENEQNAYYNILSDEIQQGPARLQLNQWVNAEDVTLLFDRVMWVYCSEAAFFPSSTSEPDPKKLEQAVKCLKLLIEKYPDQPLVNVLDEYNRYLSLAKIEALLLLSDVQLQSGQSEEAVNSLLQIIERFPYVSVGGSVSGVRAKQKLAEMYWKHLNKPGDAITLYLEIIKEYPKEPLHLFEHITMLDIVAMKDFASMVEEGNVNSDLLLDGLQEIVDSAENEIVIMMGVIERAKILRKQQHYEQAIQELREIIEQYPSVSHNYFFFDHDFSVSALELMSEILFQDLHRQEDALELCEEFYTKYESVKRTRLGIGALFIKAEILDKGTGAREEVVHEYESLLNKLSAATDLPVFYINNRLFGEHAISVRLQEIRSFMPVQGRIISEQSPLYSLPDTTANIVNVIDRDMTFSVEYRDANEPPFWHKVQTSNGNVGWLMEENIRFISTSIMLESESYTAWPMWGANRDRTRTIAGEPIVNPEIRATIQDVAAKEVLFWDANRDNLPDIIICGIQRKRPEMPSQNIRMRSDLWAYEIACIDGKTKDVLWKVASATPFSNSTPHIEDGILYCGANAINASTGEVIWNARNDNLLRLTDKPIVLDENLLYLINSTTAVGVFDKLTGEDKGVIRFIDHPIQSMVALKNAKLYYHSIVNDPGARAQRDRTPPSSFLVCFDLKTFEEQWTYPSVYSRETPPIIVGDMLLCSSIESKIYAFDTNTGKLQWQCDIDAQTVSPFAVKNGVLYFITRNKSIFGVNVSDGTLMTQFHIDSDVGFMDQVSLCIVGNVIYAGSRDGNLYALRLQDGELLWKLDIGAPIINSISSVGKVVAVLTQNNTLHLIGEKH